MKRHELYVARLQERLDRLEEDAEYLELRERAGRPFDWVALVESYSPAPVWDLPHTTPHLDAA